MARLDLGSFPLLGGGGSINEILVSELAHPRKAVVSAAYGTASGKRCLVQERHESFDLIAVWPIWNVRRDLEAVATDAAEGGSFFSLKT